MAGRSSSPLFLFAAALLCYSSLVQEVHATQGSWKLAHGTFYGDKQGRETEAGACAYKDVFKMGYGLNTAALSAALFNNGVTCGACFELRCHNTTWCRGKNSITITATNLCPHNWDLPSDNGGWCNPPREHFDLTMPMFLSIAEYKVGIVPVMYRRVPCTRKGGIKFEMGGNNWWTHIIVQNVAGAGEVTSVAVKTTKSTGLTQLKRTWGQTWVWPDNSGHLGEGMSIQVTTSDGKMVESRNAVPETWQLGQTFEGMQFR